MLAISKTIMRREIIAAYKNKASWANSMVFFSIICSIVPMLLSNNPEILVSLAPIIIWLALLLSLLISLDNMYKLDFNNGTFTEYYLSPYPTSWLLLVKTCANLLLILLPMLIILPSVLIFYHLSWSQIIILLITILFAMPALVFIGTICAAITLFLAASSVLLIILALPLYIPIIILACASFNYFNDGYSIYPQLAILLASSIIAVLIAPFLTAFVLKSGLQCGN